MLLERKFPQIPARNDSHQLLFFEYRIEMLPSRRMVRPQMRHGLSHRRRGVEGGDIGSHHFAYQENLKRIDRILAAQMESSAAHLLRQDRALEDQNAYRIGQYIRDQQRE